MAQTEEERVTEAVLEMEVAKTEAARLPSQGTAEAAGFDISAAEAVTIPPGSCTPVETGLRLRLPPNCSARIASRSGLYSKNGIKAAACFVPPLADAALRVLLLNFGSEAFAVRAGDRVAQMIIEPCLPVCAVEATAD